MLDFVNGAISMAYLASGLFFLRFWRQTGDRLFVSFAAAFALLAVLRMAYSFQGVESETDTTFALTRFAAFALILLAIINKNRGGGAPG